MSRLPRVMISSTYYDLKQARQDLSTFLSDDLGFEVLLSEHSSFPVDPDADTIENCRRRVQEDADVLVLIIGGRYGAVSENSNKSITNIEYLTAHARGIPIYTFVERDVLALLPVWQARHDNDFGNAVEDPRVFEFIDLVRNRHKTWTFGFEYAHQIVAALRQQIAYVTRTGISWRARVQLSEEKLVLADLHGPALRYALERPDGWELKVLAHALQYELDTRQAIRNRYRLRLPAGDYEVLDVESFSRWRKRRLGELMGMKQAMEVLINRAYQEAVGAPGEAGDLVKIVLLATDLGELYKQALRWALNVLTTIADEEFAELPNAFYRLSGGVVETIERFVQRLFSILEEIETSIQDGQDPGTKHLELDLEMPGIDEATRIVSEIADRLESS